MVRETVAVETFASLATSLMFMLVSTIFRTLCHRQSLKCGYGKSPGSELLAARAAKNA
jgi:hypothetical protein